MTSESPTPYSPSALSDQPAHTPGPIIVRKVGPFFWSIERELDADEKRDMGLHLQDPRGMSLLAVDKDGFACIENQGDARLWASAPDLLAENLRLKSSNEELVRFAQLVWRGLQQGTVRAKPIIDTSRDDVESYPILELADIAIAAIDRALQPSAKKEGEKS